MTPQRLPLAEFITLVAVMFAMIAFGIDSMLPAFPQIASDLGLSDVNQAQLVITVFFLGTGIGQLIMGPLSDAIGRKPVILGGILLYILGCVQAVYSGTLEGLLVARMVQGIGVSAPRTVTLALIRDLYSGRLMARVMSLSMTLFVLVPAIAPLLGQTIMLAFGWRAIFVAFILFALIGALWLGLRQGETHPVEKRRKIRLGSYLTAMHEVATNRVVMTYTLAMSLGYGGLFAYLSSAQQIFVGTFDKGQDFPLYFAGIAIISGGSGLVNSWLVMRLGMRRLATGSFGIMMVVSLGLAAVERFGALSPDHAFTLFLMWSALSFFSAGLTFGNLNALAMEPMGHIAGMAAAVMGALSTAIGVAVAIPIGQAFDGTALPLIFSFGVAMGIALLLMLSDPKAA